MGMEMEMGMREPHGFRGKPAIRGDGQIMQGSRMNKDTFHCNAVITGPGL